MLTLRFSRNHRRGALAACVFFAPMICDAIPFVRTAAAAERSQVAVLAQPDARPPACAVDVEALTLESDFTMFMAKDCPEQLRRQALRRLWLLLPAAHARDNPAL
jgi:hypothetical protein